MTTKNASHLANRLIPCRQRNRANLGTVDEALFAQLERHFPPPLLQAAFSAESHVSRRTQSIFGHLVVGN